MVLDWCQAQQMLATSTRLLGLLTLMQARTTWSGAELADRLQVTERTVRRDVERLRALSYPVEASPGVGGGYRLGPGKALPPLILDDEEAVAVAISLHTAASGTVAGVADTALSALAKLEQVLPTRLRSQVAAMHSATRSVAAGPPSVEPSVLLELSQACRDSKGVRFGYVSHDGTSSDRHVEPHRLVCTGRRWYLVARDVDREAWRSFRIDRLHSLKTTDCQFVPANPPDAVEFVTRGVSTGAYRYRARVRLAMSASSAAEWITPTTGIVESVDEDSCDLTAGANSLEAIAFHLAMFGCEFEVLEPPALADAMRVMAGRLLSGAGNDPSRMGHDPGPSSQVGAAE